MQKGISIESINTWWVASGAVFLALGGTFGCSDESPSSVDADVEHDSQDDSGSDADADHCEEVGTTSCTSDGLLITCEVDDSGLVWFEPQACEPGTTCRGETCVAEEAICMTPGLGECLDDFTVRTCQDTEGVALWSEPTPCTEETHCLEGECVEPVLTERQQQYLDLVDDLLNSILQITGWIDDFDVEPDDVRHEVFWHVILGGEDDWTLNSALRQALIAYPVGHQSLYGDGVTCMTADLFWQSSSRLGACARPYGDDFVVTHSTAGNPLDLEPGDLITAVDGERGDAMVEAVLRYPVCGASAASAANRRISAATSLLSSVPVGTILEVTRIVDGSIEELVVTDGIPITYLDCRDPMGQDTFFNASSFPPQKANIIKYLWK